MAKTFAYIDGFNFYYGVTRNSPYRWLNLRDMVHAVLASHSVDRIIYVTAPVKSVPWDRDVRKRQKRYFDALGTLPSDFEMLQGHYSQKVTGMRMPNPSRSAVCAKPKELPLANVRLAGGTDGAAEVINPDNMLHCTGKEFPWINVVKNEEKGSDVTLGARLVYDACQGRFDTAVVFSNDADLLTPIQIVRNDLGLRVEQVVPTRRPNQKFKGRKSVFRGEVDHIYHEINDSVLRRCQFPDPLTVPGGSVAKPSSW